MTAHPHGDRKYSSHGFVGSNAGAGSAFDWHALEVGPHENTG